MTKAAWAAAVGFVGALGLGGCSNGDDSRGLGGGGAISGGGDAGGTMTGGSGTGNVSTSGGKGGEGAGGTSRGGAGGTHSARAGSGGDGGAVPSGLGPPPAPLGVRWVPVAALTDEFDGDTLDDGKWVPYHHYWNGREPSQFNRANVSVTGGNLKLKSTVADVSQTGNWVSSACVSSRAKSMKRGMYSEARIRCPTLSMTGAYWFQGSYSEIDVIENFGAPTGAGYEDYDRRMMTNLHYFAGGWANDVPTPWEKTDLDPPVDEAFWVYGVWWKNSREVVFYLNGEPVHTSRAAGDFDEDMYLFFDMETFHWGIGLPTLESLQDDRKNTQYVDWVRTYELQ